MKPENVIWITTDHMRYDCIGAHGNPAMHTRNLDRLVNAGISFNHCYANSPVSVPSRASFMTGCYPQQTGVVVNGQSLARDFDSTVARVMSRAGYATRQIGKLHFQPHQESDLDPRTKDAYGFDQFLLSEEPGCYEDAYRTWLRTAYPEHVQELSVPRPLSHARKLESTEHHILEAPWQASHSGWIASQFDNAFDSWGVWPEPQFYHLGFYAPHPPLNPTREMLAPYEGAELAPLVRRTVDPRDPGTMTSEQLIEYRRHFYAMVTGVEMGDVLPTLVELSGGSPHPYFRGKLPRAAIALGQRSRGPL